MMNDQQTLVSVIVTTRNNHATLDACLASIVGQSYEPIELIVVDRDSSDGTKLIARYYTDHVYNHGPERSAQRNFGVSKAHGDYVFVVDSDMELTRDVVRDCVDLLCYKPETAGVIVPEESVGVGFWANCKRLERSFYRGNNWIEAARFFPTRVYKQLSGYDETMVSGEDWDLSRRCRDLGRVERVGSLIKHNEGKLRLFDTLRKKYHYAGLSRAYLQRHGRGSKLTADVGPFERYKLFLSQPRKLFRRPLTGVGMLAMKTSEFAAGGLGYVLSSSNKKEGVS